MKVTAMTFNIHHGKNVQNKLNLDRIVRVIEESNADIIGLNRLIKISPNVVNLEIKLAGWRVYYKWNMHSHLPSISKQKEKQKVGNMEMHYYHAIPLFRRKIIGFIF
ncbi:hypothetical protein SAMN05216389_11463 [Oceanobacillus limi]|uniref:Endonuclease/Exonuclease/phosphatase family protein n=1 Tax=Oceanobacillus limi TaxID=930131 RepID=A0A1I0FAR8_9BACI|nr:hypothetical protein SAMN05216389_11463 [Oceanobacillus limi]